MRLARFRRQLEYKCERYGRALVVIDRWYPLSKTCSACGHLLAELSLSTRHWPCPSCGSRHDRDINAAKNILAAGLAVARSSPGDACGADVRHSGSSRVQSAVKQEPWPVTAGSPSFRAGSSQRITTLRSTSPRPIRAKASSRAEADRLRHELVQRQRPARCRSTSIGKSRLGRQSPYQGHTSAPPRPSRSTRPVPAASPASARRPGPPRLPGRGRRTPACRSRACSPRASITTSAPKPPVNSWIPVTGSRSWS